MSNAELCPCGSGRNYDACCAMAHADIRAVKTAEDLMRSRYAAFVLKNKTYLLQSWHPSTRPEQLDLDDTKWLGLKIKNRTGGGENDTEGTVEFVARYKVGGRAYRIEENSLFTKANGHWVYLKAL